MKVFQQTVVETKASKTSKDAKKSEPIVDPLSGGVASDPLSIPTTSDPLSLALLDPLSQAAAEKSSAKKVCQI